MINKIEFSARNLTSKARLFLLLENARKNGIIDLIDNDLVFENESTNKIKFLTGKIIRTARSVVMKLSEKIPIRKSMKKVCLRKIPSSYIPACYYFLN